MFTALMYTGDEIFNDLSWLISSSLLSLLEWFVMLYSMVHFDLDILARKSLILRFDSLNDWLGF